MLYFFDDFDTHGGLIDLFVSMDLIFNGIPAKTIIRSIVFTSDVTVFLGLTGIYNKKCWRY